MAENTLDPNIRATARGSSDAGYFTRIATGHFEVVADEGTDVGGTDLGPLPFQLLASSLAACTAMTIRMYANRKGWVTGRILVDVTVHKPDAAAGHARDFIDRRITIEGDLSDEQRQKCLDIAKKCPVGRTLEAGLDIDTALT